jgi:hypothetical protein
MASSTRKPHMPTATTTATDALRGVIKEIGAGTLQSGTMIQSCAWGRCVDHYAQVDGWQTLAIKPTDAVINLAA